jgi:predicted nucleic acid-binding protein
MDRVYLDIGSLKRPFDDQRQPRVREESMGVAAIVARAEAGEIALLDADVEARAAALVALGFGPLDALHLAFAERAGARWFVTCDDKLLTRAQRLADALRTLVVAPPALGWRNAP